MKVTKRFSFSSLPSFLILIHVSIPVSHCLEMTIIPPLSSHEIEQETGLLMLKKVEKILYKLKCKIAGIKNIMHCNVPSVMCHAISVYSSSDCLDETKGAEIVKMSGSILPTVKI